VVGERGDLPAAGLRARSRGPGEPTPLLRDHTAFLDPRWNSIRDAPAPHPRIRHYPGYSLKVRTAFMARDLVLARLRRWR
jgi:hypothetical protein